MIRDLEVINHQTASGGPSIAIYAPGLNSFRVQDVSAFATNSAGPAVGLLVSGGLAGGLSTTVADSALDGQGAAGIWANGVLVEGNSSSPGLLQMDRSFAQGFSSGGQGVGVDVEGTSEEANIRWSDLHGNDSSIYTNGGFIEVGLSLLSGVVSFTGGGSVECGGDLHGADLTPFVC
jgi:hypothetical protein